MEWVRPRDFIFLTESPSIAGGQGSEDGIGQAARFDHPKDIIIDSAAYGKGADANVCNF
jgi:hypothetical protein